MNIIVLTLIVTSTFQEFNHDKSNHDANQGNDNITNLFLKGYIVGNRKRLNNNCLVYYRRFEDMMYDLKNKGNSGEQNSRNNLLIYPK